MVWAKGESGNPRGRKRGTATGQQLRQAITKDLPAVIQAVTTAALAGDMAACRLLLDRALPALKPQEQPVTLPLGDDLGTAARAVLTALGAATLAPDTAAKVLQGLGAAAKVLETGELEERLAKLEAQAHGTTA